MRTWAHQERWGRGGVWRVVMVFWLLAVGACGEGEPLSVPSEEEVEARYEFHGPVEVSISGNVAQVTVQVFPDEIERGGPLWARSLPYLFLFSEGTRELFQEHSGLAGVRLIARDPDGAPISRALLERGALTPAGWDRALNIAGRARTEGTESPARVRDLVRWGEDHTEFEYNPRYEP